MRDDECVALLVDMLIERVSWVAFILMVIWAVGSVGVTVVKERGETERSRLSVEQLRIREEAETEQLRIREASKSGRKRPVDPTSSVGDDELGRQRGFYGVLPGQGCDCWVMSVGMTCGNEE